MVDQGLYYIDCHYKCTTGCYIKGGKCPCGLGLYYNDLCVVECPLDTVIVEIDGYLECIELICDDPNCNCELSDPSICISNQIVNILGCVDPN